MANAEHMAKLTEGVSAWNTWRTAHTEVHPDLSESKLPQASLAGVDFSETNLQAVNLFHANLRAANLYLANISNANLQSAHLERANLHKANLRQTSLHEANLQGANLHWAELANADLWGVDLRAAVLGRANLEGANLRAARNVEFDGNDLRQTHLNWQTKGPWLTLRRKYTGTRLLFHLLLLLAFALPYVARTFFWVGVHRGQYVLKERLESIEESLGGDIEVIVSYNPDPNSFSVSATTNAAAKPLKVKLSTVFEQTKGKFRRAQVWQVLLSIDKGARYALTAMLLILYNVLRYFLTNYVSILSDEQERTGHAPARDSYMFLVWPHRIMRILYFFALVSFLFHFCNWMTAPVWLPGS